MTETPIASKPFCEDLELGGYGGAPAKVTVVVVPFPKNTIAVISGKRIAQWTQLFNSYILDSNKKLIKEQASSKANWLAPNNPSSFKIIAIEPPEFDHLDPEVLTLSSSNDDRYIAIYCYQCPPEGSNVKASKMLHQYHTSETKDVTTIYAEDGGDEDSHDTFVSVSVNHEFALPLLFSLFNTDIHLLRMTKLDFSFATIGSDHFREAEKVLRVSLPPQAFSKNRPTVNTLILRWNTASSSFLSTQQQIKYTDYLEDHAWVAIHSLPLCNSFPSTPGYIGNASFG
ncbi:hypothetical protein GYMLUDRAFT_244596 [Collybiopsis luxurians FD-317 M1]|uniref:Uncharacterized protein n=1 Tax=Collybiopsis luxurians FD-317 M1 TaxID=944289 RepID=A0A0D0CN81_9AGAR|nr:hypothetical protein GYMLUDRAFT_244596 [Collybiopsis luxurians FD-317 M1]